MTALNMNRERLGLLADIKAGKVRVSAGGKLMRQTRAGQNRLVATKVRELRAYGLVHETDLVLTDAGERVLDAGGAR